MHWAEPTKPQRALATLACQHHLMCHFDVLQQILHLSFSMGERHNIKIRPEMAGIPEYLKMPLVSDKIISGSRIPPMLKSLARRCKQHRRHPDDALLRPAPRLPRFIPFELQLPALKTWDPQLQLVEVVTLQPSFSLAGDGWWIFLLCFFPFEVEHRCFIPTKGCSVSTMITISD